jgi:hypothetical protein
MGLTVEVHIDLQTVICQVPSVSRESVAAAKLQHPADASSTVWGRQFRLDSRAQRLVVALPTSDNPTAP